MGYIRKTKDEYWLMADYGYGDGFEYVLTEDTLAEARKRKKEYIENQPGADYKIIKKRVKKEV